MAVEARRWALSAGTGLVALTLVATLAGTWHAIIDTFCGVPILVLAGAGLLAASVALTIAAVLDVDR